VSYVLDDFTPTLQYYETEVTPEEHLVDRVRGGGGKGRRIQILNAHIIKVFDRRVQFSFCIVAAIALLLFVYQSLEERAMVEFDTISGVLTATVKLPSNHVVNTTTLDYCQRLKNRDGGDEETELEKKTKKKKKKKKSKGEKGKFIGLTLSRILRRR